MEYWQSAFSTNPYSVMELRASIALGLLEKWGAVAGRPDGEDSAGRSKLGLLEPDALVARCCDIAAAAVAAFEAHGWIKPNPSEEELVARLGDLERIKEEALHPWLKEKAKP